MALTPRRPADDESTRYAALRAEVHEAFDHVALSLSCTLPMLLAETRSRGIGDDDVRHILALDDARSARGFDSDMLFQCYRSNAGVAYVTRETAPVNQSVSSFELFVEYWREKRLGLSRN